MKVDLGFLDIDEISLIGGSKSYQYRQHLGYAETNIREADHVIATSKPINSHFDLRFVEAISFYFLYYTKYVLQVLIQFGQL